MWFERFEDNSSITGFWKLWGPRQLHRRPGLSRHQQQGPHVAAGRPIEPSFPLHCMSKKNSVTLVLRPENHECMQVFSLSLSLSLSLSHFTYTFCIYMCVDIHILYVHGIYTHIHIYAHMYVYIYIYVLRVYRSIYIYTYVYCCGVLHAGSLSWWSTLGRRLSFFREQRGVLAEGWCSELGA